MNEKEKIVTWKGRRLSDFFLSLLFLSFCVQSIQGYKKKKKTSENESFVKNAFQRGNDDGALEGYIFLLGKKNGSSEFCFLFDKKCAGVKMQQMELLHIFKEDRRKYFLKNL